MLSPQQIHHFHTDGYIVLERLFGPAELDPIDAAIEQLVAESEAGNDMQAVLELEPAAAGGKQVARRIFSPFHQHQAFRELATRRKLLAPLESLIGPDINLHHSKLNMKPAHVGSEVKWHQDLAYFPHTNDDLVTTLIYLDDACEENGCLQVLPGQHHCFFEHRLPDGSFAGMITEEIADGRYGPPRPLSAPAGSAILMHCLLPHSSLANRSDRPRRTLIFEYRAADAFPIYYGPRVAETESKAVHLHGKRAERARLGGPAPMIPQIDHLKSLYEMQRESQTRMAGSSKGAS